MELFITVEEFKSFRQISKKVNTQKVNKAIELAQTSDLNDILGDFFFDLAINHDTGTYEDLMTGSQFQYEGDDFIHLGIKSMLADYAYARYIYTVNINETPFGIHKKFTEDSQPLDRNTIKDLSTQAKADAGVKFRIIEKYLKANENLFPRYSKCNKPNTKFGTQRFSKL